MHFALHDAANRSRHRSAEHGHVFADAHALDSQDLWLTHAGDTYDALAKAALPSKLQALVEERSPAAVAAQEARLCVKPRRAVAVCQVFFDCWFLEGDTALAHPGCPCPPNPENVRQTHACPCGALWSSFDD